MKTRFDLVPWNSIRDIADVLQSGAAKYGANNWCRGSDWSRYFSALCRHIFAWWTGEDRDKETGRSHLAHAGCCLLFLMEYERNNWGTDDRFTGPDGQTFTKHDGLGDINIPSTYIPTIETPDDGFNVDLYQAITKADPIDLGLE